MHNLNIIEYLMSNLSTLHTTGPLEQKRRRSNCSLGAGIGLAAAYDRGNRYLSKCMAALRSSALFSLANSRRRFLIDGLPATSLNDVHESAKTSEHARVSCLIFASNDLAVESRKRTRRQSRRSDRRSKSSEVFQGSVCSRKEKASDSPAVFWLSLLARIYSLLAANFGAGKRSSHVENTHPGCLPSLIDDYGMYSRAQLHREHLPDSTLTN